MTHSLPSGLLAAAVILAGAVGSLLATGGFAHSAEAKAPPTCVEMAQLKLPMFAGEIRPLSFGPATALRFQGAMLAGMADEVPDGGIAAANSITFVRGPLAGGNTLALLGFADPTECFFLVLRTEPLEDLFVELLGDRGA